MQKKTSVFSNAMIWFGAAVSIAEILTGTLMAPLGLSKGIAAILLGHLIGCALLYFAGLIGAITEKSAMETVKMSFGSKGALLFSVLNILQLVGWTAIMILNGAAAANFVIPLGGNWVWTLIIGLLLILWVVVGIKNLDKINYLAMGSLLVVSILLSFTVFGGKASVPLQGGISFGAAVELSVAMPLSWLPLISDYTRFAKKKKAATFASAGVYFAVSCWMYLIGLGAALFTGESDIAKIMVSAGFGFAGLIIIVFSTVTTTFLDVYSAGVSCVSVWNKISEKGSAIAVCILGTALVLFSPIAAMEGFLYLIGSVFAPLIAILVTDFFILKKDRSKAAFSWSNLTLWAAGFILYRVFLHVETPIGNTVPVMVMISILCMITDKWMGGRKEC